MAHFSMWLDADSCPQAVREILARFSLRLEVPLFFAANRKIPFEKNPFIKMIVCCATADSADNYIVAHAQKNDLVVTRDIPLAARLVERGIVVLNDRGTVYTAENIRERLSIRNFSLQLANFGISAEKTSRFSQKETQLFANALDREVQKKLRAEKK